jgi:tetratricopeptide (TPR) repeat protein
MPEPSPAPGTPPAPPGPPPSPAGKRKGWRKWLFRLVALTLVPLLLLGTLELALWVGGYGRPTDFFLDGSRAERPGTLIDNADFGRWVFPPGLDYTPTPVPFVLPAVKKPGSYRIFVLGESAAMGYPEPTCSFARVLEVMLRARYPGTHFEVVNTSMAAINSHVVRPIALQCLRHQPDLFVVHLGNNEVAGPFGAAGVHGAFSPSRGGIRANLAIKTTRCGQLLNSFLQSFRSGGSSARHGDGMAVFLQAQVAADDDRLPQIRAHFRDNLEDICAAGTRAGVSVLVCTVPVNLKDCAPFRSRHAAGLPAERAAAWEKAYNDGVRFEDGKEFAAALRCYDEAAAADDQFADLAFRQARCRVALGQAPEAKRLYQRARDLDTLRVRTDTALNETIRSVAAARAAAGVYLVDAERAFEEASSDGIPGEESFFEHVHMNFHGNYLLARTVFRTLAALPPGLGPRDLREGERAEPLSEGECARNLGYTPWLEYRIAGQIETVLTQHPPFTDQLDCAERGRRWQAKVDELRNRLGPGGLRQAAAVCRRAVSLAEGDWMLRMNCGEVLAKCGDVAGAREQFQAALRSLRHSGLVHCRIGSLLLQAGDLGASAVSYRQALGLQPDSREATLGLAEVLLAQGKAGDAVALAEGQFRKEPRRPAALLDLGDFLTRAGRPAQAVPLLQEALRLEPDNPLAHAYLGDAALKEGRRDEAVREYETALQLKPQWRQLQDQLVKVQQNAGRRGAGGP